MTDKINIVVGVPSTSNVSLLWANDAITFWHPAISSFLVNSSTPLDKARNDIILMFLMNHPEATHLLFWDTDILATKDDLTQLLKDDLPIVGGLYVKKKSPCVPLMLKRLTPTRYETLTKWQDEELVEVDATGLGFLLIQKKVLDEMEAPWCNTEITKLGKTKVFSLSEDFYFCREAQKIGYQIFVDTKVKLDHVGSYKYGLKDYIKGEKETMGFD